MRMGIVFPIQYQTVSNMINLIQKNVNNVRYFILWIKKTMFVSVNVNIHACNVMDQIVNYVLMGSIWIQIIVKIVNMGVMYVILLVLVSK